MVARAGGRAERLGAQGVRRLGALYRTAAADLAVARRRFPGDPVVARLEGLVRKANALVYADRGRRVGLLTFMGRTYWQLVAGRPRILLVALGFLIGPALLAAFWALNDPTAAIGLVPEEFRSVAEPVPTGRQVLPPDQSAEFAAALFTNNIQVTFLAFAAGILAGIGTAFVLTFNGLLLGAIAGLTIGAGNGRFFVELVSAHGVLELSCIVVTAAAGMRMGWSLVDPGHRPRREALVAEARQAVAIVLGTMPWLVLAGIVESAVTPALPGAEAGLAFGIALAAVYWALVWWRGRDRQADAAAPTGELAPSL